jgi:hypothetical protein
VGNNTSSCIFRSSVVADSSDQYADQGMTGTVTSGGGTPKLQKKTFVGVGVRYSSTAGYVLRILPNSHKWQYLRDPKGPAEPKLEASGTGKFVKIGSKPNVISIRAFSYGGTTTNVVGSVNGHGVVSTTDSGADQPDGRQTVVTSGVKGSAPGTGVVVFDDVGPGAQPVLRRPIPIPRPVTCLALRSVLSPLHPKASPCVLICSARPHRRIRSRSSGARNFPQPKPDPLHCGGCQPPRLSARNRPVPRRDWAETGS